MALACSAGVFVLATDTAFAGELLPTPLVRTWGSASGAPHAEFFAGDASDVDGRRVAIGDLGGDGISEIIVASGPGTDSTVRIYRQDGSLIRTFLAYSPQYDRGVFVATGDLDGDGADEIITGTDYGGGPHVRVFDGFGFPKFTSGYYAYDPSFRGGVVVATGDLNGDNRDEIITGAGPGGGPHVRVFDKTGTYLGIDYFPFSTEYRGGVSLASGDVDGNGTDEVIVGVRQVSAAAVKVYRADAGRTIVSSFLSYPDTMLYGINLAAGDVTGNGRDEIITAPRQGGGPHVRVFDGFGNTVGGGFFAYDQSIRTGVTVASGKLQGSMRDNILTAQDRSAGDGRTDLPKHIVVDISEQRLYAYEYGQLVRTFLVSTGLPGTPTPVGEWQVYQKIESHLYAGPDYYFPNTLWNLRYNGHYLLHGAYWHDNFGNPMSHGCTNIDYTNAQWLYEWADMGTPVTNRT